MGSHKNKKAPIFILTAYRIRQKSTGLWRCGGVSYNKYSRVGDTWNRKQDLIAHLRHDTGRVYEHPVHGWINSTEWDKLDPDTKYYNYDSRKELDHEIIRRKLNSDDEVIEILVDENLKSTVKVMTPLNFLMFYYPWN